MCVYFFFNNLPIVEAVLDSLICTVMCPYGSPILGVYFSHISIFRQHIWVGLNRVYVDDGGYRPRLGCDPSFFVAVAMLCSLWLK